MKNGLTQIQNPVSALLVKGVEYLTIFLAFVLPVKFASIVSVPEMPASYWFDPVSIVFTAWPIYLFCVVASIMLIVVLTALLIDGKWQIKNKNAAWWSAGFILLTLTSLAGWCNASCKEYPLQMITYTFGTGCFVLTVFLLLENRPGLITPLFRAVIGGTVLSIFSGIYQYFWGFDELLNHVYEQNVVNHIKTENDGIYTRILERRIQADFSVCNVYAGYLAMLLPVIAVALWKFGNEKVQPEKISRWLLAGIGAVVMVLLLFQTGSRGGVLAVGAGLFVLCLTLPMTKRQKIAFWTLVALGIAGFVIMVAAGRGAKSMVFRADYDYAAWRMMWKNPFAGTGWGDFFHDFQILKLIDDREAPHTPHNTPLLYGSQCGVLSFLTVCFLLLYPLILQIRNLRKKPGQDLLLYGILTASAAAVMDYQLELSYETPAFLGVWAILNFIAFYRMETNPDTEESWKVPAGRIALIICLFAVIAGTWLTFRQMKSEMIFNEFHELMNPRYSREQAFDKKAFRLPSPDKVLPKFRETTGNAPYNPFPWMMMSDYLAAQGDLYNAKGYANKAIELSPCRAAFYLRRAKLTYLETGSVENAAKDINQARKLFPKNPDYRVPDIQLLIPQQPNN